SMYARDGSIRNSLIAAYASMRGLVITRSRKLDRMYCMQPQPLRMQKKSKECCWKRSVNSPNRIISRATNSLTYGAHYVLITNVSEINQAHTLRASPSGGPSPVWTTMDRT